MEFFKIKLLLNKMQLILFFGITIMFWLRPVFAQPESLPAIAFQHPKQILIFADHLFGQGDYYRAITEYKRALFYFPTYEKKDFIHYRIGKSYYLGARYRAALHYLAPLTEINNKDIRLDVKNLVGLSYLYRKDYLGSERVFQEIIQEFPDTKNRDYYSILVSMSQLNRLQFEQSLASFDQFAKDFPQSQFISLARKGSAASKDILDFSPRYPWLAMSLSAVIPGTGQMYNREWSNAFVAFVFNVTLGFLAVNSFLKDDLVGGGIFSSLFLTFYVGNIYQSRRSTIKYNEEFVRRNVEAVNKQFERQKFYEQKNKNKQK